MLTVYHNPRCGKSRSGLAIVEQSKMSFEIIKYLEKPLNAKELQSVIKKLGIKPIELVRTKERIWEEEYKNLQLTNDEIIAAMAKHPILIERPIVVSDTKAVLGRPPEKIEDFLKSL